MAGGCGEQVAGVGHDGGAAGVDFVPGLEFIEFAEGAVDNDRRADSSASPMREQQGRLGRGLSGARRACLSRGRLGSADGQTARIAGWENDATMKLNRGQWAMLCVL